MESDLGGDDTGENLEWSGRKMKPPDKKKFESSMDELMSVIKQKEVELRTLVSNKPTESAQESLRDMKAEKQANIDRRVKIDAELQALNKEISKKNAELTKIQSNLQGYKNESRIDEAIRKLEYQLKVTNFKLSEEKKIVAEIDNLKRSKKALVSFNQMKREIDEMRDRQRRMREERDRYYKNVTRIKAREDELRRKTQGDKSKTETLRKDIDDLYDQKRTLVQEYKVQEKEYQQFVKDHRWRQKEELKRKKQEQKQEKEMAFQLAMAEYEASREPYEDEKNLCSTLIAYLQNYKPADIQDNPSPASSSSGDSLDPLAQSFEKEGYVLLKKKEEDLFSGLAKVRTSKRSKKEKKKTSQNKLIHHAPQTLSQFAQLEIKAPTTAQEVTEAIQQLESKKKYYESLPPVRPSVQLVTPSNDGSSQSSAAPSITESAFTESIPSTPEVYSDNCAPGFPVREEGGPVIEEQSRRLSHDSGAFELEDDSDSSADKVITYPDSREMTVNVVKSIIVPERITSTESNISVESTDSSASSGGTVIENRCTDSPSSSIGAAGDYATFNDVIPPSVKDNGGEKDIIEQITRTFQQAALNETTNNSPSVKIMGEKLTTDSLIPSSISECNDKCDNTTVPPSCDRTVEMATMATDYVEIASNS